MTTCPECGSTIPDSFGECPTCGAPQKSIEATGPTVDCPHCGERISADAEACPACGHLHVEASCSNHADRTANGQCVICGMAVCADCNKGGDAHFLCGAHQAIPVVQGWAQVYTTSDDLDAQLIRDNLQAEGLDSRILSQKDHFVVPVDFGDLAPVRVLVPAYDYSEAADLIAGHLNASGEVQFGEEG